MIRYGVRVLRFILAWVITIGMSSLQLVCTALGCGRWGWERIPHAWSVMTFAALGVKVRVKGAEHLKGPAVFVLNHQSLLDVALVPYILPREILYVVKKELQSVPIFGPAVCKMGAIAVDRRNTAAAVKSIKEGLAQMPGSYSVMVFPEGTRSLDGRVGAFKKGFAHIASVGKLPVIPIGIAGAYDCCGYNEAVPRPGVIECTVGAPIRTDDWTVDTVNDRIPEVEKVVRGLASLSQERLAERPLCMETSAQAV